MNLQTRIEVHVAQIWYSFSPSAPGDYISLTISVAFPAGVREQSVVVSIVDDRVLENTESFMLELAPLSNGVVVGRTAASVLIEDNDGNCLHNITVYTLS